ncbi:hypothetical protein AGLY_001638, partial [Aphis glycines]
HITCRNNALISNFRYGFRWQSEYPWYIIQVRSKQFSTKSVFLCGCNSKTNHCKYLKFSLHIYISVIYILYMTTEIFDFSKKCLVFEVSIFLAKSKYLKIKYKVPHKLAFANYFVVWLTIIIKELECWPIKKKFILSLKFYSLSSLSDKSSPFRIVFRIELYLLLDSNLISLYIIVNHATPNIQQSDSHFIFIYIISYKKSKPYMARFRGKDSRNICVIIFYETWDKLINLLHCNPFSSPPALKIRKNLYMLLNSSIMYLNLTILRTEKNRTYSYILNNDNPTTPLKKIFLVQLCVQSVLFLQFHKTVRNIIKRNDESSHDDDKKEKRSLCNTIQAIRINICKQPIVRTIEIVPVW